jgi:hypothetical protein
MKYDLTIERIDNGYIFSGEGCTTGKHYFSNLESFGNALMEELRERDKVIKEHGKPEKPFTFKLESDL